MFTHWRLDSNLCPWSFRIITLSFGLAEGVFLFRKICFHFCSFWSQRIIIMAWSLTINCWDHEWLTMILSEWIFLLSELSPFYSGFPENYQPINFMGVKGFLSSWTPSQLIVSILSPHWSLLLQQHQSNPIRISKTNSLYFGTATQPIRVSSSSYKVFQPIYNEMEVDHLVQDVHHLKQQLLEISKGEPILIIFDDMINSDSVAELSNLCLMK